MQNLGLHVSEGGIILPPRPYVTKFEPGQHTPGFILDAGEAYLPCGSRLAAVFLDGMTNRGARIWPEGKIITSRRELASGFVVEEFLARFKPVCDEMFLESPPHISFSQKSKLTKNDCWSTSSLINWLWQQSENVPIELLTHIGRSTLQKSSPFAGVSSGGFSNSDVRALMRKSPDEICSELFDRNKLSLAIQLTRAVEQVFTSLRDDFANQFEGALEHIDHVSGGSTISGVIKLTEGKGVLIFSIGDSVVGFACDNVVRKILSNNVSPSLFPNLRLNQDGSVRFTQLTSTILSLGVISEEKAKRGVFFLHSDGFLFNLFDPQAENLVLNGHCETPAQLVKELFDFVHSKEQDLPSLNHILRSANIDCKKDPDDKGIIAFDGARLFG